jgi:Domain of unknown function (DUF5710)
MRLYLHQLPFECKSAAKEGGARFDTRKKMWYIENAWALEPCRQWLSERHRDVNPWGDKD